jgi:hypothetical protein
LSIDLLKHTLLPVQYPSCHGQVRRPRSASDFTSISTWHGKLRGPQ